MILEIPDSAINELQVRSIHRMIARAKHAHWTDVQLRINGQTETHEADWLKHIRIVAQENSQQ